MIQVFVDMDGVLADFDAHYEAVFGVRPDKRKDDVDWGLVRAMTGFYADIPPMADMIELWSYLKSLTPSPIVPTGVPSSVPDATEDKQRWVKRHLGELVEVRCCLSREKSLHARSGDVLIDDWEKYRSLWEAKGGRWITHVSAESSIEALRRLGIEATEPRL